MSEAVTAETNLSRKVHLLRGLIDARSMLSINYPGLNTTASTSLVDVLPDTGEIVLDELIPRAANVIEPDSPVYLRGKLKGVLIEFKSRFSRAERDGDILSHFCAMPNEVVYHQKRREFRLSSPAIQKLSVNLAHEESNLQGRLIDISVGGTNVELKELPDWAAQDQTIVCELELDDDLRIATDAVIRHVGEHQLRHNQVHRLGLQLLSLTPAERRKLRQWINLVERKRLRRD